jgi:hypothetical protein
MVACAILLLLIEAINRRLYRSTHTTVAVFFDKLEKLATA